MSALPGRIRLPSGAATKKLHETANNIYAVVSGTVRSAIDGQAEEGRRTVRACVARTHPARRRCLAMSGTQTLDRCTAT
jgi:gentisate 1,2-dioxygenase